MLKIKVKCFSFSGSIETDNKKLETDNKKLETHRSSKKKSEVKNIFSQYIHSKQTKFLAIQHKPMSNF